MGRRRETAPQTTKKLVWHGYAIVLMKKSFTGNNEGERRYRIGDYRVLREIKDDELLVLTIEIDYRREAYN